MTRSQWANRGALAVIDIMAVTVAIVAGAPPDTAVRVGVYVFAVLVLEGALRLVLTGGRASGAMVFATFAQPGTARPPTPAKDLEDLQRAVLLATASMGAWHFRLRPRLREITDALLEDRHGVRLDQDRAAADILGARAWELLRPDRPAPDDRLARGLPVADLEALVASIEEL